MSIANRVKLYREVEELRARPLIVYITSSRRNAEAQIARDVVSEILTQLEALPKNTKELDLLIASDGGDGTVAWRLVSLIRERVEKFSVLVPQAAFSAATLIALGADEIVMHRNGNLGPTDPQITNRGKNVQFGSEDLVAFLKFARDQVGLRDQAPLLELFKQFSAEVGFVGIGVAARSAQLSQSMAEKLLRLHMRSENQMQKAKVISEVLNTKFFHHGYAVSRTEAKEIGLPISAAPEPLEKLMWSIWLNVESELRLRQPFSPVRVLRDDPGCGVLFAAPPPGSPTGGTATATYRLVSALVESSRTASRFVVEGDVIGQRLPDLNLKVSAVPHREGWVDEPIPPTKPIPHAKPHKKSTKKS